MALILSVLALAMWAAASPPRPALAHAVYVFAYADGDEICTESYFTRKNRVQGGRIVMQDASGTEIESAVTGSDGNHCFRAPPGEGDLKFVVLAGEGHRGEFTLPAADRPAAAAPVAEGGTGTAPSGSPSGTSGTGPGPSGTVPDADGTASGPSGTVPGPGTHTSGISEEALRSIVREEIRTQISPVVRALAEARRDRTPGLREIVGGLGWVAGIGGLVMWLKRRPGGPGRKD
jgi:nickel transport protein